MNAAFLMAFDRVVGHEGAFQDDAQDRGNWTGGAVGRGELRGTKFGISAATYPQLDIENLTLEDARRIYHRDWWQRFNLGRFRPALAYQLFDAAINHGTFHAARFLQLAAGVADDGVIGPITREAVWAADLDDLLLGFLAERLDFMTQIPTWNRYGAGWARRVAQNLRYALQDN